MSGSAIGNDVVIQRWDALAIVKQFTREITGTPTAIAITKGCAALALASTSEAEAHRVISGLQFRIADLQFLRIVAACTANLASGSVVSFGLCNASNDDPDAITEAVLAKVLDTNAVVMESDDGTTDVDDTATGLTLGTTLKQFVWNFRDGFWRGDARDGGNVGGSKAILTSMDNAAGNLRDVCRSTQFTLGAATGPLQVFAQITKATGAATDALYIQEIEVGFKRAKYAVV